MEGAWVRELLHTEKNSVVDLLDCQWKLSEGDVGECDMSCGRLFHRFLVSLPRYLLVLAHACGA